MKTGRSLRGALALLLAIGVVVGNPVASGAAPTPKERRVLKMVNRARIDRGLPRLRMREVVRRKAHRHSAKMARAGTIFHVSCLSCLLSDPYGVIGENVAMAPSLRRAHRALMRSPAHRANILHSGFRIAGFGVVKRGGYFYITQRFLG